MDANESQSFTSPYNSNNFMSPPIGGMVKCTTCHGSTIQGKVMAYDQQTKMLALSKLSKGSKALNDVSIVNVAWCSLLEVIEEPSEAPETLLNLNVQKLNRRAHLNIEQKFKEINSLGEDVPSIAQHLFFKILQTLNEVEWNDKKIVVMNSVIISPPYDVNSCTCKNGENNSQALEHVKKIVKKFTDEFKQPHVAKAQETSEATPPASPMNENPADNVSQVAAKEDTNKKTAISKAAPMLSPQTSTSSSSSISSEK